jgi:hypothetical protein
MAGSGKFHCSKLFVPWAFVLSLSLGILFVYLSAPTPLVIVRYPTPENAGKETYRDGTGRCYRYRPEVVPCEGPVRDVQFVSSPSSGA